MTDEERTSVWRVRFAWVNVYHVDRWRQVKGGLGYYSPSAGRAAERTMPPKWDVTAAPRAHACPLWLLEGDHAFGPLTVEMHRRWTPEFPNVRLRVLPEAGHDAWVDAPGPWRRALAKALSRTTRCPPGR